jgi:hypothetical protein
MAEGGREDDVWRGDWRVSHLFGNSVSCDHEVSEDASVEGAHGVGEEADVGGGGQLKRPRFSSKGKIHIYDL